MANLIDNDAKVFTGNRIEGHGQNKVIRISTGRLYTAHIKEDGTIEVSYSDDSGSSWSSDTTFTDVTSDMVSLCKSELDDVFLAYTVGTSTPFTSLIKKRDHTTGTWSEISNMSIADTASTLSKTLITYSRYLAHRLYAVWFSGSSSSAYINVKYSDNYGTTWSSIVANSMTYGYFMSGIDTSPNNGNIYIGYTAPGIGGNKYMFGAGLNSSGVYFGNDGSPDTHMDMPTSSIELAMDTNGDRWYLMMFKWGLDSNYHLRLYKNGTSLWDVGWSTTEIIYKGCIAIGLDGADNSYILYTKIANNKTYYRKWNKIAGTMGVETVLSSTTLGYRPGLEQHSLVSSTNIHTSYYGD